MTLQINLLKGIKILPKMWKNLFLGLFIFERERERAHKWVFVTERVKERKTDSEIRSRLWALSCQCTAWCEAQSHELWDHDLNLSQMLNWLSHPGIPQKRGKILNTHLPNLFDYDFYHQYFVLSLRELHLELIFLLWNFL